MTGVIFLVLLDQAIKVSVKALGVKTFCNKGVAFGFFPADFWIFVALGLIFLVLVFGRKAKIFKYKLPMVLIVSGGISNFVDRARLGCVIDFIDFRIWPVFNLADVMVSIGVIILVLLSLKA